MASVVHLFSACQADCTDTVPIDTTNTGREDRMCKSCTFKDLADQGSHDLLRHHTQLPIPEGVLKHVEHLVLLLWIPGKLDVALPLLLPLRCGHLPQPDAL